MLALYLSQKWKKNLVDLAFVKEEKRTFYIYYHESVLLFIQS